MRTLLAMLALALVLPLAGALPAPASPVTCGTDCRIEAASTGYSPVVTALPSGASVTWHGDSVSHATKEQTATAAARACFEVLSRAESDAPPVRFDIVGSQLVATVDGEERVCSSAVATATGAALPYFCVVHPTMRGVLVITAA